jgi:hypothetical protein
MKKIKENWENELYLDPRSITEEDKKTISDFINKYNLKSSKKLTNKRRVRTISKRKIKA